MMKTASVYKTSFQSPLRVSTGPEWILQRLGDRFIAGDEVERGAVRRGRRRGRHIHLVPTDDETIDVGGEHLCLLVRSADVDSRGELDALQTLRDHDIEVEDGEPRKRYGAYGRAWAAYVRDPDGRRVELKLH